MNVYSTTNPDYDSYTPYMGTDLGMIYMGKEIVFKLWAPSASKVLLNLYAMDLGGVALQTLSLIPSEAGTWMIALEEKIKGQYYTVQTQVNGRWGIEVPDPYAKVVGRNGKRGQIIDLQSTNPEAWEQDHRPLLKAPTDAIIYELHIRDVSMHPQSGILHKGKFIGLTERNTKNKSGLLTGLSHLVELNVTHIHLLPVFDFLSVDESQLDRPSYNWGYDPQNYNVPEGSYATNPSDGAIRIKEFKQLIQTLHQQGLSVVMDVVFNHTGVTEISNFNQLVPGYYYRQNAEGGFSDASACGNETASERAMMRKFIVDSVIYWAKEYHIDGFRFDLMGIHDIATMNEVAASLHEIDPSILIYGEGWTGGDSPLSESKRALKKHISQIKGVAAFSDDLRDAVKGNVFNETDRGFASGKLGMEESIKFGIVAATDHPQVDYSKVNYSDIPWASEPSQTINYVSCHDNHTLWDRLLNSQPERSEADRIKMHLLANTIVLTSQGIPFLHAGVEMLRTKGGEENSYKSPDAINQIDWTRKTKYLKVFRYYQQLIQLRKNHPAFRMPTTKMIQEHLSFLEMPEQGLIGYTIKNNANGDKWKDILILFNGNLEVKQVPIPEGVWQVALAENRIDEQGLYQVVSPIVTIVESSAMVLFK